MDDTYSIDGPASRGHRAVTGIASGMLLVTGSLLLLLGIVIGGTAFVGSSSQGAGLESFGDAMASALALTISIPMASLGGLMIIGGSLLLRAGMRTPVESERSGMLTGVSLMVIGMTVVGGMCVLKLISIVL